MLCNNIFHSLKLKQFLSSGPEEGQVARAKVLTEDLLVVVRQEHAKVNVLVQQQQMELHHAQAQYAAYSMGVSFDHVRGTLSRV